MLVRKLPVVVEAHQIPNPDLEDALIIFLAWAEEVGFTEWDSGDGNEIEIKTLEGVMTARTGDWVIKGVEDEFWAIKESIFDKTYEVLKTTPQPAGLDFGATTPDMLGQDGSFDYPNSDL